jgi:hypothetical protein
LLITLLGVAVVSLSWTGIVNAQEPGSRNDNGTISVDADKWVSWNGPGDSIVYMQIDDETPNFFAEGSAGVQGAPWMTEGHLYTFILQNANGNEIGRAQLDLRKAAVP